MSFIDNNLRENITYWSAGALDGFGKPTFGSPTTIPARWEQVTELFIDNTGNEVRSMAKVFLGQAVSNGDYLYKGVSSATDPTTVDGAYEVRQYKEIPGLYYDVLLRVAML
jgi:hypothetical protein